MSENFSVKNTAAVVGVLSALPALDHITRDGKEQYGCTVLTRRKSGAADEIPVILGKDYIPEGLRAGDTVEVLGEIRTYDLLGADGRWHLEVRLHGDSLRSVPEETAHQNDVKIEGVVCRAPGYRMTPLGKKICDLLVAVDRGRGSSYVPCITWKGLAIYCSRLTVGQRIALQGRLQSRVYHKPLPDGSVLERVAYEVSGYWAEAK